jgi:hypothetical protein
MPLDDCDRGRREGCDGLEEWMRLKALVDRKNENEVGKRRQKSAYGTYQIPMSFVLCRRSSQSAPALN